MVVFLCEVSLQILEILAKRIVSRPLDAINSIQETFLLVKDVFKSLSIPFSDIDLKESNGLGVVGVGVKPNLMGER